jgi:pimeloyl-ACP methyl ester carboxylesterase
VGQIAENIPHAKLEVVAGAPHMLFMEQPQKVFELIHAFLAEDAYKASA